MLCWHLLSNMQMHRKCLACSTSKRACALQAEPDVMQRLMGVPRITDSIRAHYSRVASPDALAPAAGASAEHNTQD